jgi:hypothetical protein
MSSVGGIVNRFSTDTSTPAMPPASTMFAFMYRWSPPAVPTWQSRGFRPSTPDRSNAKWISLPNSRKVR